MDELSESRARMNTRGQKLALDLEGHAQILERGTRPPAGRVAWSADEMAHVLEMDERERQVFYGLKMRFDSSTEFRPWRTDG